MIQCDQMITTNISYGDEKNKKKDACTHWKNDDMRRTERGIVVVVVTQTVVMVLLPKMTGRGRLVSVDFIFS